MSQLDREIEDAVRDITDAFGYFSPGFTRSENGRTYNDRKMSVQTFRKDDTPQGYSVLVTAPDESRHIVYLRRPEEDVPEIHRPGRWTGYLRELQKEALSMSERKRDWETTEQPESERADRLPIDDSAIFGEYDSPAPNSAGPERHLELLMASPECQFYSRAHSDKPTEETE